MKFDPWFVLWNCWLFRQEPVSLCAIDRNCYRNGRISSEINENGFTMSDRSKFPPDFEWNITIRFLAIEVWFSDRSAIFGTGKSQFIQKVLLLEYWNFPWAMPRYMRVCLPNFMTIGEILSELAGMKNYRDRTRFSSVSMSRIMNLPPMWLFVETARFELIIIHQLTN